MNEIEKAYIAGLVDGEGCIRVNKTRLKRKGLGFQFGANVRLGMCEEDCIRFCQEKTGLGSVRKIATTYYKHPHYVWDLGTRQTEQLLREILPYLVGKREQALIVLEYCEQRNTDNHHKLTDEEIARCDWYFNRLKEMKSAVAEVG